MRGVGARPRDASPAALERLLDSQDWGALAPLIPPTVDSLDAVLARLRAHCRTLLAWNRRVSNLMSKNDEPRIVARHVAESLAPARWIYELGIDEWLDFGSGAGFPALPLAISGIGRRWVLVESRRPKILFLRKVLSEIDVVGRGIEVVGARLETIGADSYQVGGFTARATERLTQTLAMAASFVTPGGSAFLWKGSRWQEEIQDRSWSNHWRLVEERPIPNTPILVSRFIRCE